MKITAYYGNYRKYGFALANTNKEAEQELNRLYHKAGFSKGTPLFKIDNSKLMVYNEARLALGFAPCKYA